MEYRELGRSGIKVSCIGLGGSPLGGGLFQERESLARDLAVTIEQLEENVAALAAPSLTEQEMLLARGLAIAEPGA